MKILRALDLSLGTVAGLAPALVVIAIVVLAVFFFGQRLRLFGQEITLAPDSLANLRPGEPRDVSLYTLLPKDAIRSIDDPHLISAAAAEPHMADPEFVIGLSINGDARAYPVNVLSRHETVNDIVGGVPIVVTYCPLCYSGIVFDRRVGEQVLEFGVSGKMVMNDLVMYDRQTSSLWQQMLGEGISGKHKGARLAALPATQTTWGQWRITRPDTHVLDKEGGYASDAYSDYYSTGAEGVLGGSAPTADFRPRHSS